MNPNQTDAYKYLGQAQQARKAGDKKLARQYAEQAARLAPELEDTWLMLAALASPRASVVFMEKALQINPTSERVLQGMHWAVERLKKEPPQKSIVAYPAKEAAAETDVKPAKSLVIPLLTIFLTLMCVSIFIFGLSMLPSIAKAASNIISHNTPAYAIVNNIAKATPNGDVTALPTPVPTITDSPTDADSFPTVAATETRVDEIPTLTDSLPISDTATPEVNPTSTPFPTSAPTAAPTHDPASDGPTPTALPTDTAEPLPTAYIPPTPGPAGSSNNGRWIDVDLTHQAVYAYEGSTLVNSFIVSTGTWQHPTVTGQYHIYIKYLYKDMTGPGYSLPNVPYTMFFYQGYAIHGTYWHSNFGTPMSHGCVNLSIPDSEWMYNFASVGTLVNVHY